MPRSPWIAAGAAAVLALSACGTTEDAVDAEEGGAEGGGEPVSVTDARGETIELDAPAERVVALEWAEAEMAATLGVMPVGVAQAEDYGTWVQAEPLDEDVEDVGVRQEPSVDAIVALEPDLVVTGAERGDPIVDQLEEQVPVLVTEASDASRNLERLREDFQMIAEALGAEEQADEVLAEFDASLEEGREAIDEAGAEGAPFVLVDGWEDGGALSIRPFADGALASDIGEEMGLENVWPGEGDERWGLGETDVEGLTTIDEDDATFLYDASDGNDLFGEGLEGNDIWESLPFVEQDRVHKMTDGIWVFGGPRSSQQLIDEYVEIFAQ
jgi:ferric hydroxamate transport system substrate-binding protein